MQVYISHKERVQKEALVTSEKAFGLQSTLRERKRNDGSTWCVKGSLRSSHGILSDE